MNQNRSHSKQQRKISGSSMTFVKHQNVQKCCIKISSQLNRSTAVLSWLNNVRWFLKGTIDLLYILFQRNSKSIPVSKALSANYVQCRAAGFLCEKRSRPQGRPWIQPPVQSWRALGSSLPGEQGHNFSAVWQDLSNSLLYNVFSGFFPTAQEDPEMLKNWIIQWRVTRMIMPRSQEQ